MKIRVENENNVVSENVLIGQCVSLNETEFNELYIAMKEMKKRIDKFHNLWYNNIIEREVRKYGNYQINRRYSCNVRWNTRVFVANKNKDYFVIEKYRCDSTLTGAQRHTFG